jgi:hypothetical protein
MSSKASVIGAFENGASGTGAAATGNTMDFRCYRMGSGPASPWP